MSATEGNRLLVKICGVKTPEAVETAIEAGADMLGFNFFPRSPRYVEWQAANALAKLVPADVRKIALLVNPNDYDAEAFSECIEADFIQLHGSADGKLEHLAETTERVAEIRRFHEISVMKAIGVASTADLAGVPAYAAVSDLILLDAKPPRDAAYPGGHGRVFDWGILAKLPPDLPFMLSGGLDPENVGEAIRQVRGLGCRLIGVDVSSGVESALGVKDSGKIRAFVAAAREADGVK